MNQILADVAKREALRCFHGSVLGTSSNLEPIADLFPKSPTWGLANWENCWCAAFVYYCCVNAEFHLPVRYPDERVTCNFAGCIAWEQWAKLNNNNFWYDATEIPEIGDIVLFDRVFQNKEHDHIGIIIGVSENHVVTAEGNFNNVSAIVTRQINEHIRGYVRIDKAKLGGNTMFFKDIKTERLLLKNISMTDNEFLLGHFSDAMVNRYLFDAEPLASIQEAEDIIKFYLQPEPRLQHRWIIIRESDGEKMGTCGFHCWDTEAGIVDVGYDLKENFWGNGYMREAMSEIIAFAKEKMHVKEIKACIYVENPMSIRLAEKLGFVESGTYYETFRGKEYLHKKYSLYLSK